MTSPGVGNHAHSVQFYSDDLYLLDATSEFLAKAIVAGNPIVVIATEQHRHGIQERLKARGFDIAGARQEGRYVALDASETLAKFMVGDEPNAALFAEVVGGIVQAAGNVAVQTNGQVAAFGEMVALLFEQGKIDAAIRLEQLWNELARTHSFSLYCAYPMRSFSRQEHGNAIARICAEHSHVIPAENYLTLSSEEDRLRSVAQLQQKAQALEAEVALRESFSMEVERRKRTEHDLAQLSVRLMQAQDEERRRIARELHDSFGQYLVALQMNLDLMDEARSEEESRKFRGEARELVARCLKEVRTLSYLLHPPNLDDMGLVCAISWYTHGFSERSGIRVTLDLPSTSLRLPPRIELALFRVLQEALTNIHRHSQSAVAEIRLSTTAKAAILEIRDQGKGIPAEIVERDGKNRGVGLTGMRSRVQELHGEFEITSTSSGTRVTASIPLNDD
jgi:signal transduction histidine kinase